MSSFRIAIVASLLLQGCASVPLATIWKMRSFGVDDLAMMNPAELRAAVQCDDHMTITGGARIRIEARHEDGTQMISEMPLEVQQSGVMEAAGLTRAVSGKHWIVYALSRSGQAALLKLQAQLAGTEPGDYDEVEVWVQPGRPRSRLSDPPDIRFEIWFLWSRAEGYIKLLNETKLPYPTDGVWRRE